MSYKPGPLRKPPSHMLPWIALLLIIVWLGMSWSRVGQSARTTKATDEKQEQVETETAKTPDDESTRAEVITEMLNLRADPTNDDQTVIGTLMRGEIVQILKKEADWLLVRLDDGKSGYIADKDQYIRLLD